jgi:hypothetical protein
MLPGNIEDDVEDGKKKLAARVAYVGSVVFSSSQLLLNRIFSKHSGSTQNLIKATGRTEFPA